MGRSKSASNEQDAGSTDTRKPKDMASDAHQAPPRGIVNVCTMFEAKGYDLPNDSRNKLLSELSQQLTETSQLGEQQPMSWWQEAAAMLMFCVFPGCMFWLPFTLLGGLWVVWKYWAAAGMFWFALTYTALAVLPAGHWPWLKRTRMISLMFRYTSFRIAWEEPLRNDPARYMFICPPHGVLPMGNILCLLAFKSIWGFDFYGLTTNAALRLPVLRQLMAWVGCKAATREVALQLLEEGQPMGVTPGGVAEIFESNSTDEVLFIRKRRGFIRLALQTGTPIVPCYTFGNTKLFHAMYDRKGWMRALSRKLGFGALPVWGRWGLPVIIRQPLLLVTGRSIQMPQVDEPSQEQIDEYHEQCLVQIQELFDKYKHAYGWGDKQLVMK